MMCQAIQRKYDSKNLVTNPKNLFQKDNEVNILLKFHKKYNFYYFIKILKIFCNT